jgi:long-chain acyl-CoA synthetase
MGHVPDAGKLIKMERQSVTEFLANFQRHRQEWAYVHRRGYRTERWSYGQVAACAFQAARELEVRGVGKGDRVLLWGENCAEWIVAWFGCALRGAISVPMDDVASPDFARRVADQVGIKLAIVSRQHAAELSGVPFLVMEELRSEVAHHSSEPYAGETIQRCDPLEIIFTSGTTAEPKGVVLSHGNVLANVAPLEEEIGKYLKYERWVHPVRFLNLLPLSHVFGQFLGIFLPQLLNGSVIFHDSLSPAEVIQTIHRERVSVLVAVPRMLQSLRDKLLRDETASRGRDSFSRRFQQGEGKHFLRRWWMYRRVHKQFGWKFWAMISGGAALDHETEEFWGRLGYAVIQGYGLTETTSLISVNHPFRLGRGSIGKVLPGREVKLAEDGEILVRGGGVASGYWSSRAMQPVVDDTGWYRTGDIGALDAEGHLYFKGRKKDVFVTPSGMNVYPEDLEAALRRQPQVRDCVVLGMDRNGNAEPYAVLILKDGADSASQAVQGANQLLAEYQRMHEWCVWLESDFPRTSTQKPRLNLIRETVLSQLAAHPVESMPGRPIEELVSRVTGRKVTLSAGATLEGDLHLSSLDRVELMSALEDRYQVDLSETSFTAARTVGDLEQLLGKNGTAQRAVYHYPKWALRWPTTWVRFVCHYLLVRPAILLLGKPRLEGRENLRGLAGPFLVISNHIDDVDVGFVQYALPFRLRHRLATATGGEALEALRTPTLERWRGSRIYDRVKWFLGVALLNLFPLPREAGFRHSFAHAGYCVDHGYSVLVFPEGYHTTDGELRPFRAGIGLLANDLRVPVLPVRIDGLFEVKQSGQKFAKPGRIRVRIGRPVQFAPTRSPESIAAELQNVIEQMGRAPKKPNQETGL